MIAVPIVIIGLTLGQVNAVEFKVWHEIKGRAARINVFVIDESSLLYADDYRGDGVTIWSMTKREKIKRLELTPNEAKHGWVTALAVSADEKRVVAGTHFGFAIWDLDSGKCEWHKMPAPVGTVAFSSDNDVFATGIGSILTLWSAKSLTRKELCPIQSSIVSSVAYSSDSHRVVAGRDDGSITVCDSGLFPKKTKLRLHADGVLGAYFCDNDKKVVTAGYDGSVKLLDIETGQEKRVFYDEDLIGVVAYARKKSWIAVGTGGGKVAVINVLDGKVFFQEVFQEPICSLAFSERGTWLAISTGGEYDDNVNKSKNALMRWMKLKQ